MSEIRDPQLWESGELKIEWVRHHMPLLEGLEKEFKETKPFKGLKVALSVHLEAKTAHLCEVLAEGGAEMYVTGSNPLSTQDGPVDAVPHGLACAVTVVEEVLAGGVVHKHHREPQPPLPVHRLEAENSGRGLLAATDDIRDELRITLVDHRDEVSAVIYDDVRAALDDSPDAVFIFLRGRPMDSEDVQPLMHKSRSNIVLG